MTFYKKTVRDVPLDHKIVLVRVDYNVPLDEKGKIADDYRIRASLDTIKYLSSRGSKVILISHLGRPKGVDKKLSLRPVAARLAELLRRKVTFISGSSGPVVAAQIFRLPKNSVILLENLRFDPREEENSLEFARDLVACTNARYFVEDGFGVVHRKHASTDAITHFLPSVAGFLLEREYLTLTKAMQRPKRPLVAVLGGVKVKDKIEIIDRLIDKADRILIGGNMANTFLANLGCNMQATHVEEGVSDIIKGIYKKVKEKNKGHDFIYLPADLAVAKTESKNASRNSVGVNDLKQGDIALDIGDRTIDIYCDVIKNAGTVIWNGTVGKAEIEKFSYGSARIALELAKNKQIDSILGGGDTTDFILHWEPSGKNFTHISTGGGASLELMSGKKLPGIEALLDA